MQSIGCSRWLLGRPGMLFLVTCSEADYFNCFIRVLLCSCCGVLAGC